MFEQPTNGQSPTKIIENGFKLFILCFSKVLPLVLADAALSSLLYLLIPELNSPDVVILINTMTNYLPYLLLYVVMMLFLQTAIFCRINAIITQSDMGNIDALLQASKKLLPIFLATWLYTFLVGIGLMLLIPGVIFAVSLRFFTPLILFDNATVINSLQRSHQLVWGKWWQTAIVLMVPLLISMTIGVMATLMVEGIMSAIIAEQELNLLMQITYLTVDKLFNPLFYAIILLLYYDLKGENRLNERVEKQFVA